MFDTIAGLPVHVLVIHAVVVLGPVAGLTAIAYAALPAWRRVLRLPLAGLAVLAALAAVVAVESGDALEDRLEGLGIGGPTLAAIEEHSDAGELARTVALTFAVVALVATLWLLRPDRHDRSTGALGDGPGGGTAAGRAAPPVVGLVVALVLAVAGAGLVVATTLAGHSGSSAVWSDIGSA